MLAAGFLTAPAATGGGAEPDRSAAHIGPSYVNHGLNPTWIPACESVFGPHQCPTPIPSGIISTSCDTDSWGGLGMHQGFGGVLFCSIRGLSTIHLKVVDEHIEPLFRVTCLLSDSGEGWHKGLGTFRGEGIVTLPNFCAPHHHDPSGTTRVGIFLHGPPDGPYATRGTAYLTYL